MSKTILVTGATGKQGGSVVSHLVQDPSYIILAATRNASSGAARELSRKGRNIHLVQGDLNDIPALFAAARDAAGGGPTPIWGVFSVQAISEHEVAQGTAMVDASAQAGVKQFVYTSVERGGDAHSWENETPVPHFQTKARIEQHLRDHAGTMGWTILRPTAFMDNLAPGFAARVFMTTLQTSLGDKKLQWVATHDIGLFAKRAFDAPDEYRHQAIGLAGADLNVEELCAIVQQQTGVSIAPTFSIAGYVLKYMVPELGKMANWFATEGYGVDIETLKKRAGLMDLKTWLEKESAFPKK